MHNSDIFTQDWQHLGQVGKGEKYNWRKQLFQNWNTALSVFCFFYSSLGRDLEIVNEKGKLAEKELNIWGLLETEVVPSCSYDHHCAKERTMGMALLSSNLELDSLDGL